MVDLRLEPGRALDDQIVALPTVVRRSPGGAKRLVGTMTDLRQAMAALGISSQRGGQSKSRAGKSQNAGWASAHLFAYAEKMVGQGPPYWKKSEQYNIITRKLGGAEQERHKA